MVQLILVELQPYPFGRVGFSGIELDYWNSLLLMIASALRAALNTEERESLLSSLNRMMGVKLCLYLTWRTWKCCKRWVCREFEIATRSNALLVWVGSCWSAISCQGGAEKICYTAISDQNLRSRLCVRLLVTRPKPEFQLAPVEHRLYMGWLTQRTRRKYPLLLWYTSRYDVKLLVGLKYLKCRRCKWCVLSLWMRWHHIGVNMMYSLNFHAFISISRYLAKK